LLHAIGRYVSGRHAMPSSLTSRTDSPMSSDTPEPRCRVVRTVAAAAAAVMEVDKWFVAPGGPAWPVSTLSQRALV